MSRSGKGKHRTEIPDQTVRSPFPEGIMGTREWPATMPGDDCQGARKWSVFLSYAEV